MSKKYFVSGIGTDVGKTLVSAVLVHQLKANYWKPIQCGDLHNSDSMKVSRLCPEAHIYPESYALKEPASPHYAASLEQVEVQLEGFTIPDSPKPLVIEGAGGLMVPLNHEHTVLDLMKRLAVPVVLVSRNYLGSINHTLLSIEMLLSKGLPIAGLIFNGDENMGTQNIIEQMTGVRVLGRVEHLTDINEKSLAQQAQNLDTL